MKTIDFKDHIIRQKVTSRGGGVEISLSSFGFEGEKMSAYQNYLGGGMLGRVASNNTLNAFGKEVTEEQQELLDNIEEQLRCYYFKLTNPEGEWESQSYEQNQGLPVSAY